MNVCTCQGTWEPYLKASREYSLALKQAEYASFRFVKTTDKKFKDAWKNYDEYKEVHKKALEAHLEARKNCPEHGVMA